MPALDEGERQALQDADAKLLKFQRTMEEAARSGALNPEQLERFIATIKDVAGRVNDQLLPQLDARASNEISHRLISVLTRNPSQDDVLGAADSYLMDLEAVRHVFRDLLQEHQPETLRREAKEIVGLLESWLPSVSVPEMAELLGLSVRQLQRKRHDDGPASSREQLVAHLVAILRHAWTDRGVMAWFERPRHDLGGERPIELLDDPAREQDLLSAARSGRVQGGA